MGLVKWGWAVVSLYWIKQVAALRAGMLLTLTGYSEKSLCAGFNTALPLTHAILTAFLLHSNSLNSPQSSKGPSLPRRNHCSPVTFSVLADMMATHCWAASSATIPSLITGKWWHHWGCNVVMLVFASFGRSDLGGAHIRNSLRTGILGGLQWLFLRAVQWR